MKILILALLFSSFSFAGQKERKILKLVTLEIRSIAKMKNRDQHMSYRLFELYSERLQLLRSIENENVFKGVVKKENAYTETNRLFIQTQEFGEHFIKKYKKSRFIPDVYVRLASNIIYIKNNLEQYEPKIKDYLSKALKLSSDPDLRYKAQVTLAELDYNLNRYKEAVKNYEVVVRNHRDPGHTKHLLNYSWCLFKVNRYSEAVASVKKSFFLAKEKPNFYDDTRSRVGQAINYFYTYDKRPEAAIDFHGKYFPSELADNAVKVVELSLKQISETTAMSAEAKARRYCTQYKNNECLFRLSQVKLDVFKASKQYEKHFLAAKDLEKEYKALKKSVIEELENEVSLAVNNIGETASFMQVLAYKGQYLVGKDKKRTYDRIIGNYDILKTLKPEMHFEYAYLQGELSYKEKFLDNAAKFYKESFVNTPKKKENKDQAKKVLESMLAVANEKSFKNDKFFEYANVQYLKVFPREKQSQKIYEALFNFYFNKKKFVNAEKIVKAYHKKIPTRESTQREMQTTLTDYYIKKKDVDKVMTLLGSYQKGYLNFSKSFIDKNIAIFGGLVFEKAKKIEESGDSSRAIAEYEKIYSNELYPNEIRMNAAFNVGINRLKKHEADASYQWLSKVINSPDKSKISEKLDAILAAAQKYYLLQKLDYSKKLYSFVSKDYCLKAKTYKDHFLQIQELNLATNDYDAYQNLQEKAYKCDISKKDIASSKKSYIENLVLNDKADPLVARMKNDSEYYDFQEIVLDHMIDKYWSTVKPANLYQNTTQYNKVVGFLDGNRFATKNVIDKVRHIKTFASFAKDAMKQEYNLTYPGEFSLQVFEQKFTNEMTVLNSMKERGIQLADASTDPDVYSAIIAIVHKNFSQFRSQVENYKIISSDQALKTEIKNNLDQIAMGLKNQENEFLNTYKDLKRKNVLKNHFVKLFKPDYAKQIIGTSIAEKELID